MDHLHKRPNPDNGKCGGRLYLLWVISAALLNLISACPHPPGLRRRCAHRLCVRISPRLHPNVPFCSAFNFLDIVVSSDLFGIRCAFDPFPCVLPGAHVEPRVLLAAPTTLISQASISVSAQWSADGMIHSFHLTARERLELSAFQLAEQGGMPLAAWKSRRIGADTAHTVEAARLDATP